MFSNNSDKLLRTLLKQRDETIVSLSSELFLAKQQIKRQAAEIAELRDKAAKWDARLIARIREPDAKMVEAVAMGMGLDEYKDHKPPVRWPRQPNDRITDRYGTVALAWDFTEKCRARATAALSAAADAMENDDG